MNIETISFLSAALFVLSGCSTKLEFADPATGERFAGAVRAGQITAARGSRNYSGEWMYTPNNGALSSPAGQWVMLLKSVDGDSMRCAFDRRPSGDQVGKCVTQDGGLLNLTYSP